MSAARALPALALCVGLVLVPAAPARAGGGDGPAPLRWEPRRDLVVTGAALAVWLGSELGKDRLAPSSCRFCGTNALDASARDALVWARGDRARRASDLVAFGLLPGAVAAHQLLAARSEGDAQEGLVDLLVVVQAAALAANVNQLVKFSVGRQRPFVRYGNSPEPDRAPDSDDNLSFYSGHTSFAFAVATAAGTVSSLRGYRTAPWVWAAGLTLAAGTGYLRVAADKHYLTDVLTGAAVGTAFGVALPRLLHGREAAPAAGTGGPIVTFVPLPLGVHVAF
jgi:membrane-associated phospholipid phosphatase